MGIDSFAATDSLMAEEAGSRSRSIKFLEGELRVSTPHVSSAPTLFKGGPRHGRDHKII